ncbi:MAG: hypothetical protein Q9213_005955 [Squamulea squamosa]
MIRLTRSSNTGQVLTSLGELISEGHHRRHNAASADPLPLFQEALGFFQRCLNLQESQFTQLESKSNESEQQLMELDDSTIDTMDNAAPDHPRSISKSPDEDAWAMILEPVTMQALMDTLLAQVDTLTSICGLLSARRLENTSWIEEYYRSFLHDKLNFIPKETGQEHEAALVTAKYRCAVADVNFNAALLDIPTYEHELTEAYNNIPNSDPDPDLDPQALCDRADAEIVFNSSLQRVSIPTTETIPEDNAKLNVIRWKHLTKALDNLTLASKLPNAKHLPRIHLRRGDCELLRRRLGASPSNYEIAIKSASTLLRNAEIYYRAAARLAKAEGAADEEVEEASVKEAVVIAISAGDSKEFCECMEMERIKVKEIMEEMSEEGLLWDEDMKIFGF